MTRPQTICAMKVHALGETIQRKQQNDVTKQQLPVLQCLPFYLGLSLLHFTKMCRNFSKNLEIFILIWKTYSTFTKANLIF